MARWFCVVVAFSSLVVHAQPEAPPFPARNALIVGVVVSQNPESAKAQGAALSGFVSTALRQTAISRVFADQEALAMAVAQGEVETLETIRTASGLRVAWVEPSSASGYLLAKAHLLRAGINPVHVFTVQDFLGSHDAVCKAVAAGTYDLGATFSDQTSNATRVSGCEGALGKNATKLSVVTVTDEVPNDVLVAAPNVKHGSVELLREAGRAAPGTELGKESLKAAFLAEAVADVTDADFTPVRTALDAFAH
jgi:phosphonate transport system substrate-binding protein